MMLPFKNDICGSTTVGGRGQVVIPMEVRKSLGIKPNDKLMVFANKHRKTIMLTRMEDFNFLLHKFSQHISKLENEFIGKRGKKK
ncbi:MAG: AbrB/MazE/SpoVT family DNA-binding domain-containing protein [Candidatus Firestonebacteria bacterium]